jgi:hypothetical protein
VNEKETMDIPQPLLDLGYDPAKTATLFAVFKDTVEISIKQALANSPPLVSSPGTELKHNDKFKAADLRMALLMGKNYGKFSDPQYGDILAEVKAICGTKDED